jgi:hypothetical protein
LSEALDILEQYLQRVGMSRPRDAAFQFQVTLLRQWTGHLEQVLDAEPLTHEVRLRIIRAMIYAGAPNLAEAEVRATMQAQMRDILSRAAIGQMTPNE